MWMQEIGCYDTGQLLPAKFLKTRLLLIQQAESLTWSAVPATPFLDDQQLWPHVSSA